MKHGTWLLLGAVALGLAGAQPCGAQQATFGVRFGLARTDLPHARNGAIAALHWTVPVGSYLLIEPSLPIQWTSTASYIGGDIIFGAERQRNLYPELQVQLQAPGRALRPYAGIGVGGASKAVASSLSFRGTVVFSAGARGHVGPLDLGAEIRQRNIQSASYGESVYPVRGTREATLSVAWPIGRS